MVVVMVVVVVVGCTTIAARDMTSAYVCGMCR